MRLPYTLTFVIILWQGFASNAQLSTSWIGHYEGDLIATNVQGKESTFHMELDIDVLTDSSYTFTLIYGEDSLRQERAYKLIVSKPNQFILDEQNGIKLSMNLYGNKLISVFEVLNSTLHVTYTLNKKGIQYELTSSNPYMETTATEEKTTVTSYKTLAEQRAFLKRSKK